MTVERAGVWAMYAFGVAGLFLAGLPLVPAGVVAVVLIRRGGSVGRHGRRFGLAVLAAGGIIGTAFVLAWLAEVLDTGRMWRAGVLAAGFVLAWGVLFVTILRGVRRLARPRAATVVHRFRPGAFVGLLMLTVSPALAEEFRGGGWAYKKTADSAHVTRPGLAVGTREPVPVVLSCAPDGRVALGMTLSSSPGRPEGMAWRTLTRHDGQPRPLRQGTLPLDTRGNRVMATHRRRVLDLWSALADADTDAVEFGVMGPQGEDLRARVLLVLQAAPATDPIAWLRGRCDLAG